LHVSARSQPAPLAPRLSLLASVRAKLQGVAEADAFGDPRPRVLIAVVDERCDGPHQFKPCQCASFAAASADGSPMCGAQALRARGTRGPHGVGATRRGVFLAAAAARCTGTTAGLAAAATPAALLSSVPCSVCWERKQAPRIHANQRKYGDNAKESHQHPCDHVAQPGTGKHHRALGVALLARAPPRRGRRRGARAAAARGRPPASSATPV
jgi:hypothetical protein